MSEQRNFFAMDYLVSSQGDSESASLATQTLRLRTSRTNDGDKDSIRPAPLPASPIEGEFSGWGSVTVLQLSPVETPPPPPPRHKIGQAMATAIAANDLVGSVLYTVGVTTAVAGKLAPLSLLLVSASLFFPFKQIIREVGQRIPLNGGVYSCMLLSSNKAMAAVGATCSILDYVCTAVVSAATAAAYFYYEFGTINVYWAAIIIMALFGLLTMVGVKESSTVSLGILISHMLTMLLVVIAAIAQFSKQGNQVIARDNFMTSSVSPNGWGVDLFLGYCVGMLGVTGFETSSNYIEEQAEGVFPKTLRNMCYLVLALNPVVSLLALCVLPIDSIVANSSTVISVMAGATFGKWLRILVAVDAVIVLCGGVLTAFVGVGGLMEHMANDNLLPAAMLYRPRLSKSKIQKQTPVPHSSLGIASAKPSRLSTSPSTDSLSTTSEDLNDTPASPRAATPPVPDASHSSPSVAEDSPASHSSMTPPLIPITFFTLCLLLYVVFSGDVSVLSLVFSMSFLSVLAMFTACCLTLRIRSDRESSVGRRATGSPPDEWGTGIGGFGILLAGAIVVFAVAGNAVHSPNMLGTFLAFFFGVLCVVWGFLNRVGVARVIVLLLFGGQGRSDETEGEGEEERRDEKSLKERLFRWVKESRERPVAYFTNGESLHHLNHVIHYVLNNEPTSRLIIVHCFEHHALIPTSLEENCRVLDHVYPDLRLDLVLVQCRFDESVIPMIAQRLGVQKNLCLVSRPWKNTKHVGDIKGARVILLRR
ncbi:hypothetical protein HDU98_010186 [Podochytrium sp. JEL0797]|nr:hypothetical protein HDU98_010186 [Podochytrium sp. JEL0797]